jgi:hypothetical protein
LARANRRGGDIDQDISRWCDSAARTASLAGPLSVYRESGGVIPRSMQRRIAAKPNTKSNNGVVSVGEEV